MESNQVHGFCGAVKRNLPPLFKTRAMRPIRIFCVPGGSKNIKPQATTASNVRPKNADSSTSPHSASASGNRDLNAAIIVGDASTPETTCPCSIKTSEIGTPLPQPRSRIALLLGSVPAHSRTSPAPTLDRPRFMNSVAMASYPLDLSTSAPGMRKRRKQAAVVQSNDIIRA